MIENLLLSKISSTTTTKCKREKNRESFIGVVQLHSKRAVREKEEKKIEKWKCRGGNDMVWRRLYIHTQLITLLQCTQNVTKYIEWPCHQHHTCVFSQKSTISTLELTKNSASQLHFTSGSCLFPRERECSQCSTTHWGDCI